MFATAMMMDHYRLPLWSIGLFSLAFLTATGCFVLLCLWRYTATRRPITLLMIPAGMTVAWLVAVSSLIQPIYFLWEGYFNYFPYSIHMVQSDLAEVFSLPGVQLELLSMQLSGVFGLAILAVVACSFQRTAAIAP